MSKSRRGGHDIVPGLGTLEQRLAGRAMETAGRFTVVHFAPLAADLAARLRTSVMCAAAAVEGDRLPNREVTIHGADLRETSVTCSSVKPGVPRLPAGNEVVEVVAGRLPVRCTTCTSSRRAGQRRDRADTKP
jgi:hypothetical protein